MSSAEKIKHLKLIIGAVDVSVERDAWAAPTLPDGVPKGAVVEIYGPKKYEWLILFLKQHPEIKIFWAENTQQVLPTALVQRGLDLKQITFGILGNNSFVSLRKIIQSQVYEVVIAPNNFTELRVFRAFQLITEKSNNTLFLTAKKPSIAWPISLQLDITQNRKKEIQIDILKQRYGRSK